MFDQGESGGDAFGVFLHGGGECRHERCRNARVGHHGQLGKVCLHQGKPHAAGTLEGGIKADGVLHADFPPGVGIGQLAAVPHVLVDDGGDAIPAQHFFDPAKGAVRRKRFADLGHPMTLRMARLSKKATRLPFRVARSGNTKASVD